MRPHGSRPRASSSSGGVVVAIAREAHNRNGSPARALDRVAASGAAVALAGGLLLPFVEFRPNRILAGSLHRVWEAGGVWGWLLLGLAALALAGAFAPERWRARATLLLGAGGVATWLLALGAASVRYMPAGVSAARVSAASGAWVSLVGFVVLWFEGARAREGGPARVWRVAAGALVVTALLSGWFVGGLQHFALVLEYYGQSDTFWQMLGGHVLLSVGGTAIAASIGIPLGILASRVSAIRATVIPFAGIVQTIPSLALYGLLVVPLGLLGLPTLGTVPALVALTLYALLPIVRNTFLGVSGVDQAIIDAGRGMGMRRRDLMWRVELPLALPLLLEGVRAALVMTVGVAAVMAIIGASTLGTLIFLGWGQIAADLVLLGAIPMVILSLFADRAVRALERTLVSPGIRVTEGSQA